VKLPLATKNGIEGRVVHSPVTCRSPEKSRNKLKERTVKVAAGGFICNQDHPEDHPGADNENKFSFHVSVSFCG